MEEELAEAIKQREEEKQQWVGETSRADAEVAALRSSLEALERQSAEVALQESQLASLREAERLSREALEKEKLHVARLENEAVQMNDAKLASQEKIVGLETELASMRDAADRACQDAAERGKLEVEKLEQELVLQRQHTQRKEEILAEVWRHLQSLAAEGAAPTGDPADLSLLLPAVQSVETQLTRLKEECGRGQKRCDQLTHSVEDLQGEKQPLRMLTTALGPLY